MQRINPCRGGRSAALGALWIGIAAIAGSVGAQTGLTQGREAKAQEAGAQEARAHETRAHETAQDAQGLREVAVRDSQRIWLSPRPTWSISGAWTADGSSLLLVDAGGEVLEYSTRGALVRRHEVPLAGSSHPRPSWIQPWREGYLVEQEDAGFVIMDSALRATGQVDLLDGNPASDLRTAAVYQWAPIGSGELIALGDAQLKSGEWKTGLLRVTLENPPRVDVLTELEDGDDDLDVYLVGLPLLAAVEDRAYLVDASGRRSSILEVRPGKDGSAETRRLSVPVAAGRRPLLRPYLSEPVSLDHMSLAFQELERSSMIAGIYGWEDELYLLFHRPNRGGAGKPSVWSLVRFDPDTESLGEWIALPTAAPHITVIPGPESWAVLEKSRVRRLGEQDIASLVLIPSSEIRR